MNKNPRTNKIVALIQARMGSTRLPGKTLAIINGKPLLDHIIERVKASEVIDAIVVATTRLSEDDVIEKIAKENHVGCFRGNTDDVLDRFFQAAKKYNATVIVRITADDPFKDPEIIDKHIRYFLEHPHLDYVSNTLRPTYPEGLDTEVFSFQALEKAWRSTTLPSEREHVTPFIWKNPDLFKCMNLEYKTDLSGYRWTVDYKDDLEFTRAVYEKMGKRGIFHMQDILDLLKKFPHISHINQGFRRNAGYLKSLKNDKTNK